MTWIGSIIFSEIIMVILQFTTTQIFSLTLQWILALIFLSKNILTALIMFYYSFYLIKKNMKQSEDDEEDDLKDNLGLFVIEDFDVAMKSKELLKQFRIYITNYYQHYYDSLNDQNRISNKKIGGIYLSIFQLITIFNLMNFYI